MTQAQKDAMGDNWDADEYIVGATNRAEVISAKQAVKRTLKMYNITLKAEEKAEVGAGKDYETQAEKDIAVTTLKAQIGSMKDLIAKDNISVFTSTASTFFFYYMVAAGVLVVAFTITSRE